LRKKDFVFLFTIIEDEIQTKKREINQDKSQIDFCIEKNQNEKRGKSFSLKHAIKLFKFYTRENGKEFLISRRKKTKKKLSEVSKRFHPNSFYSSFVFENAKKIHFKC
jgi:hypothetical protein